MANGKLDYVWGDKAIREEIAEIIGYRPSRSTVSRWSKDDYRPRLPVRHMPGVKGNYIVRAELVEWCNEMLRSESGNMQAIRSKSG